MNEKDLVRVGIITKALGIRGEMSVMPLTDDPKRFLQLQCVVIDKPGCYLRHERLIGVRFHRGRAIIALEGCSDADAANQYRGAYISITEDQLAPLKKDSYFIFDLIGCSVYDMSGASIGELVDVLETGSNDVYVIHPVKSGCGGTLPKEDAGGFVGVPGHSTGGGSIQGKRVSKKLEAVLVPALKSVVKDIDIENKRIVVDYKQPEG